MPAARTDTFGQTMRRLRVQAGLRAAELARHACVDASYISRIERTGYIPTSSVIAALARALQLDELGALLLSEKAEAERLNLQHVRVLFRQNRRLFDLLYLMGNASLSDAELGQLREAVVAVLRSRRERAKDG